MRTTMRRYSRSWLVHAIIVALAIAIGAMVALSARPTRSHQALPRGTEVSVANFSD